MNKWKQLILITGVLVLILVPLVLLLTRSPSPEQQLERYLSENNADSREREAYFFALQYPQVLKVLPCYCGCVREGHKSNYNCFFKDSEEPNTQDTFDHHGLHCPMCVDIALKGKMMYGSGVSLKVIREEVDKQYKMFPHLHATETPIPKE